MTRRRFFGALTAFGAMLPCVKSLLPAATKAGPVKSAVIEAYETAHVFTYYNGGFAFSKIRWRAKSSDGTWSKWQDVQPPTPVQTA